MIESPLKLHILGASGSGVSTLGSALAEQWALQWLDMDDYFWEATEPPFTSKRAEQERIRLVDRTIEGSAGWVMSGSMCGWGDRYIDDFTHVVFVQLQPGARMERLLAREVERYGERIKPGGDMHKVHLEFVDWARRYDTAGPDMRSLAKHRQWLELVRCPIINVDSEHSAAEVVAEVTAEIERSR